MRWPETHRLWMAVLLGAGLLLMPVAGWSREAVWIDDITALVKDHQELAKSEGRDEAYNPYLGQLMLVRLAFESGAPEATRVAMNRLMDMLEHDPTGAGIATWSAKTIFDFCGKVTPAKYHDAERHTPALTRGGFDYWGDNVYDPGAGG